jgi:WD40 repeat protein
LVRLLLYFLVGEYIATGSLGGNVSVWSLSKGVPLREIQGNGDTFDVSWSADGSLLCSCFSSGMLCVMDTTGSAYLEETAVTATASTAGGGDRDLSATAAGAGAGAVLKVEGRSASSPAAPVAPAPAAAAGEGTGDASAAATATEASAAGQENSVEMSVDDALSAADDTAADTAAAPSAAEAESKTAMDSEEVVMTAVSAADAPMLSAEDEVDADI